MRNTTQKMKFSMKDFFSKADQIRSFLQIWSHLLKKSLMENFIFCVVNPTCIDLNFTNVPRTLQISCVIQTRLSDFPLMTLTIMRKMVKNRGLESFIIGHLNSFPTGNLKGSNT